MEATYALFAAEATRPWVEAMFRMRPQLAARMAGSASRVVWKAELRLMAMIASHFSTGKSSMLATCWMPALLTRMSTRPIVRTA